jgi:hypothetical protein
MNVPDQIGGGFSTRCEAGGLETGLLTSVEDPKRDELDLDDGRDDTHPTSRREERSA